MCMLKASLNPALSPRPPEEQLAAKSFSLFCRQRRRRGMCTWRGCCCILIEKIVVWNRCRTATKRHKRTLFTLLILRVAWPCAAAARKQAMSDGADLSKVRPRCSRNRTSGLEMLSSLDPHLTSKQVWIASSSRQNALC